MWTQTRTTRFFDKFYLTSFICLCGRTKLPVFPLSSKLVQKLVCQLLNKSIGELSEQARKRKPETEVANKYNINNTRVTAACSAVPRLSTEVFCYGWSSAREVVGPRNYYSSSVENLRPKESLWNLKVEAYGNKSKKKSNIEELLEEVADVAPQGVDTKALKGNNHPNRQILLVQKLS